MDHYTIGIEEIDDTIGELKKGSNILLIGPPMSGKEFISNHIIHDNASKNENALMVVTTCEPAIQMIEKFKELEPNLLLSRVGFVDCVSIKCGVTAVENKNVKLVNGPEDLTAIGVKISQLFEDFYLKKKIKKIHLHINSLSTLLMYSNIQTIFRFLHVFTSRIKMANALGIYVLNSEMHDEQVISTIKQLCDGMIEVKTENDRNFLRTVGILPEPTPWLEYQIEGEKIKIVKEGGTLCGKNIKTTWGSSY
jgi:KaiC/GvpD/RAD55 family RecA-like ATPase